LQLNLFFHSLAMLCSLASVAFATADVRLRGHLAVVVGFVVTATAVAPGQLPDPVWVGSGVAAIAVAGLARPGYATLVAAGGGALAGIWMAMLRVEGLPVSAAASVAGGLPALAAILSRRRPHFAPTSLREEALLLVLVLGIGVAAAPGVAAGWQSGVTLNLQQKEVASQAVPAWTLLLTLGAATIGGLYTTWMRR
jgi:hypothetical protein